MGVRTKIEIGIAAVLVAILFVCVFQRRNIARLTAERDRYRTNVWVLQGDVETYRIRDSLAGARVQSLELNLQEYERFRADDARLIKELKARNRDLAAVNATQAETIIELRSIPKDTVVLVDSVLVPARAVHCGDAWFDFNGIITASEFTGTLRNRDSLIIAETVQYKRFLGFLWKTNKVKSRWVDCVSKNPHSTIMGVDYIVIEK